MNLIYSDEGMRTSAANRFASSSILQKKTKGSTILGSADFVKEIKKQIQRVENMLYLSIV
jgi:hypothetical protein